MSRRRRYDGEAGTTLVEVLAAIFVLGVGLLALLVLFPLGALEMAQAVQDDRTATVAGNASALSISGEDLIRRTASFVNDSLAAGSVDADAAARLRSEYEAFALRAEDIEHQLLELQDGFDRDEIGRYVGPLLAQIRAIRHRIYPVTVILRLIERRDEDR